MGGGWERLKMTAAKFLFCIACLHLLGGIALSVVKAEDQPGAGLTSAVDSDYFRLYTAPSSLGREVGLGVFAKTNIPESSILCEYRGAIFSEDTLIQTDKYFEVVSPNGGAVSIVGVPEVPSVCTIINDCVSFHKHYSDEDLDRFERKVADMPLLAGQTYNAMSMRFGTKVFIISIRAIAKDEEIFYSYGSEFWVARMRALRQGLDVTRLRTRVRGRGAHVQALDLPGHAGEAAPLHSDEQGVASGASAGAGAGAGAKGGDGDPVEALLSDYLQLYSAPSGLAGAGMGVFARTDIPANTLLCEYRGAIVSGEQEVVSDKAYRISAEDGTRLTIYGVDELPSVCALINDCIAYRDDYPAADLDRFEQEDAVPLLPGLAYNSVAVTDAAKVFFVSSRAIAKDEEVFLSYGSHYWMPRLRKARAGAE